VEIVVAELGESAAGDQMYRITFDGSVADEHGYVAMGGQADQVATVLKERYTEGMSLSAALTAALAALAGQGNGDTSEVNASQLEVAVLMRGREHRAFRRLTGRRLEELLSAARTPPGGQGKAAAAPEPGDAGSGGEGEG
jgi:proteasome alpha subunit